MDRRGLSAPALLNLGDPIPSKKGDIGSAARHHTRIKKSLT